MPTRRTVLGLLAASAACPVAARTAMQGGRELIFAEVTANGRPGSFLVDTGAPTTVLDTAFVEAIGAERGEGQTLRGAGGFGAVPGHVVDNLTLQAKGGPKMQLDPSATDLGAIGQAMQRPLDGILGSDYLATLIVELDYRSGAVRFLDPRETLPPADASPLTVRSTPYIRAAVTLGGKRAAGDFQIDTGSNTAVELYAPFARRVFPGARGEAVDSVGIGGESHKRLGRLDVLEAAGLRLAPVEANFADTLRPDDAGPNHAGILGGPVFAGKVVVIDYARAKLWIRPPVSPPSPPTP